MSGYSADSQKIALTVETITTFHGGNAPTHVYINPRMANNLKREVFGGGRIQGKIIHGCRIHVMMHWDVEQFLCTHTELPQS
jgi:hypothetical protein